MCYKMRIKRLSAEVECRRIKRANLLVIKRKIPREIRVEVDVLSLRDLEGRKLRLSCATKTAVGILKYMTKT